MRKEMTIAAVAALGGLLAASSTSQANTVGYTFTDINVPGSSPDAGRPHERSSNDTPIS